LFPPFFKGTLVGISYYRGGSWNYKLHVGKSVYVWFIITLSDIGAKRFFRINEKKNFIEKEVLTLQEYPRQEKQSP
jgi:hypothetical protein